MMDKRPLNPFEQQCYDLFLQGCTVYDINRRLKVRTDCIVNARYKIMEKGYTLPKLEAPSTELPKDPELTKEIMRAMSKKRYASEEEKQQIVEYRKSHTIEETAEHFGRSTGMISKTVQKYTPVDPPVTEPAVSDPEPNAPDLEDEPAETPVPVIAAVRGRIHEIDKYIAETESVLAEAMEERHELTAWLEVRYHGRP